MNNSIPSYILRFLIIMLLQILIFNYLNIFGYINPSILLYFILIIPFETPAWLFMTIAFSTGIIQDSFVNTGGIYAASLTLVAFIRPFLLQNIASRRDFEKGIYPCVNDLGWQWFIIYTLCSTIIMSIATEMLMVFSFANIGATLLRILWQTIFTTIFIAIFEILHSTIKRTNY